MPAKREPLSALSISDNIIIGLSDLSFITQERTGQMTFMRIRIPLKAGFSFIHPKTI